MHKAMAELDAEQRKTLLSLADLGLASFSSALIVCVFKVFIGLV